MSGRVEERNRGRVADWTDGWETKRDVVREALLQWFDRNKRQLPWREERSAYRTWISEIMLQQTQVETVRPYFERFVARFPTVEELASAPEEDVLHHWAGLGYYSRARSLHAAAKCIVEQHGCRVPSTVEELLALSGIGRYTAGAIASIAYDIPAPILDGNVMRVLCRILELRGDPRTGETNRRLWQAAEELVVGPRPGAVNESLMELGALVCISGVPRCGVCPISLHCSARLHGLQEQLPEKLPPPSLQPRSYVALVLRNSGKVLLQRLSEARIWKGLWVFPTDFPAVPDGAAPAEALQKLAGSLGLPGVEASPMATIRHGVMNWSITLKVFELQISNEDAAAIEVMPRMAWVDPGELDNYALPSPHRRIARFLVKSPDQLALF